MVEDEALRSPAPSSVCDCAAATAPMVSASNALTARARGRYRAGQRRVATMKGSALESIRSDGLLSEGCTRCGFR